LLAAVPTMTREQELAAEADLVRRAQKAVDDYVVALEERLEARDAYMRVMLRANLDEMDA